MWFVARAVSVLTPCPSEGAQSLLPMQTHRRGCAGLLGDATPSRGPEAAMREEKGTHTPLS